VPEAISEVESRGIRLNVGLLEQSRVGLEGELRSAERALRATVDAGINLASPKQLSEFLYDDCGLPVPPISGTLRAVRYTKKGEKPTGEASIDWLRQRYPDAALFPLLLQWRKLTKDLQFHTKLPEYVREDGRIHCQMSPSAESGRIIARNPNLLQMPQSVRHAFEAEDDCVLIVLDFSGLEWRILAEKSRRLGYPKLYENIFAGLNPHSVTARDMFPECSDIDLAQIKELYRGHYDASKIINYSINYGKSGAGLAAQLGISKESGQQHIEDFYQANKGIERVHRTTLVQAQARGKVHSLVGRPRPIEGGENWKFRGQPQYMCSWVGGKPVPRAGRQALNVVQNDAADVVMAAMIECERKYPEAPIVLQVHDELVFEVHASDISSDLVTNIKLTMGTAINNHLDEKFVTPLDTEGGCGENWKEAGGK
jgi:DNA polymerase-1